jgi:anti-anti-sigma regulatory factor
MQLDIKKILKEKTIRITGNINQSDCYLLRKELLDADSYSRVLIDLTAVNLLFTDFINILVEARILIKNARKKIKLIGPNKIIEEMFVSAGIDKIYEIRPNDSWG